MDNMTTAIIINRPVEVIFSWLTDFRNHMQWQPNLVEAEITSPEPFGIGTTYRYVSKVMGCRFASSGEITAYEPNRVWGQKSHDGSAPVETIYELKPCQNGTKVIVTIKPSISGFPIAGSFVREQLIKSIEEQNIRLKQILES